MKKKIFYGLIFLGIVLLLFFIGYIIGDIIGNQKISGENTENIIVEGNIIHLDSLSLKQKLAQMIMVRGDSKDLDFVNLNVGGIFLDRQISSSKYQKLIEYYQGSSKIKLFVATDLEGAWTPFRVPNEEEKFPDFSKIETAEEAYQIGYDHGILLKKIGFNLNFAPVSEFSDIAYGGRVFSGTDEEIKDKLENYISGLQENVYGTCKHYPGRALFENLHEISDEQIIEERDIELFDLCIEENISSIMISHQLVTGILDSKGKPSSVSKDVISSLENFEGLIIADEINMDGLSDFYGDKVEEYVDLINAGEQLILDFKLDSKDVYELIFELEKKVNEGFIDEEKIDSAVEKILILKGYELI